MADFVKVATVAQIPPGTAKLVQAGGQEIALFNVAGTFHALDNSCTHVGGPLCEGEIAGAQVTCPWHGAIFDIATGSAVGPPAFEAVAQYKVLVEDGDLLIEI